MLAAPQMEISRIAVEDDDPEYYLQKLIVDNTCEVCGETYLPDQIELDDTPAPTKRWVYMVTKVWLPFHTVKPGYTIKHTKLWRICRGCEQRGRKGGGWFQSFVFPIIKNMNTADLINDLIAVQPMAQPQAHVFYMDYARAPRPEERVRGRCALAMTLDDANWRLDPDAHDDMRDAAAGAIIAYNLQERTKRVELLVKPAQTVDNLKIDFAVNGNGTIEWE